MGCMEALLLQTPAMTSRWLPLLMVLAAALPGGGSAQSQTATVLSIGDGDTIRVRQGGRSLTVRLACIDAPETAQTPWGQQARQYLQRRLPIGQPVTLEVKTVDRYGRTVAEVRRSVNLNLAMVESGQAFAYRHYLGDCDAKAYLNAEEQAQRQRLGVWHVPGGIMRPWEFRRRRRGGTALSAMPRDAAASASSANGSARRYRCREIGSFALAQQLLQQGHWYLDRDGDGVACEALR